ncbi:MAG: hypothetical protein IKC79_03800 [Clostridia bacterium]|nr:hypothetical protein [Clostridia bacterium]
MAKIGIRKDTFGICDRIEKIDKDYFVVYDTGKKVYEVHHAKQLGNTYCISVGKVLDMRAIIKLKSSNTSNLENIIKEIENHNQRLENDEKRRMKDMVTWRAQELYNYAMRKDDNFADAYSTTWV